MDARIVVLVALTAGALACGGHGHSGAGFVPDAAGQDAPLEAGVDAAHPLDAGHGQDSGIPRFSDAAPDAPDGGPACAAGTDLVYVASEERQLYSFNPATAALTPLGSVDCAAGSYVNSMSVDRDGNAWINYGDGSLWKASVHSPTCTATGFKPNQQGVGLFGMGFSAKSSGSTTETLFIDDLSGGGLGYIDTSSMTLLRLGPFAAPLANGTCELTGTGLGELFGFFAGSPLGDSAAASVVALDPTTLGALKQWPLPTVDTGSDWAFAYWGGDFFLFTADKYNQANPYTTITRLHPADSSLTVLVQDVGFRVVGAGSSTCAPTAVIAL